jgi:hypothetical protein
VQLHRILVAAGLLCACGSSLSAPMRNMGSDDGGSEDPSPPGSGASTGSPGVLTAGVWDDNLNFEAYLRFVAANEAVEGNPPFRADERAEAHDHSRDRGAARALDVVVVIDTTGSMGDEIGYLRADFLELVRGLSGRYPGVTLRHAVVAYRDEGDEYVVLPSELTSDAVATQRSLDGLRAEGGGDWPEAPDQALARASQLAWSDGQDAAKVLFWVSDAPHHEQNAGALAGAVRDLRGRGVHVYPVAASGVNALTELTMRSAAQLTLGRYLFLTDDSGVGNPHAEPSIPCYWVTKLDYAMERVLRSEIEGTVVQIDPGAVIRAMGDPRSGVCTVADRPMYCF